MSEGPVRVSLVIPAFNEADRIGDTLEKAQAYFIKRGHSYEILVVDDGSSDSTAEVVRRDFPWVQLVSCGRNRGKGFAMRTGVPEACGEYCIVYDADGSTPIEEIDKLWSCFDSGAGVVIGSRALPGSDVKIRQPKYRRLMGRVYNNLLRGLRLTSFRDTQCGFKAFTSESSRVIFPRLTVNGFGSDCEMLHIAKLHGIRVDQVPVQWINSMDSRVNPVRDSLYMFCEVILIRVRSLLGRYS